MSTFADNGRRSTMPLSDTGAWQRVRRSGMRGAVSVAQLVAVAILIALLAVALWWFMGRSGHPVAPPVPVAGKTATVATAVVATKPAPASPAPPAPTELSIDDLYKDARTATADNRVVAPAGNNALEYYLAILARQPDDASAADALRELFPFATGNAEDQINQGNFDEANRIITLLATADPSNYTLTILRSKLDAKKKQKDRDAVQQAQQAAATSQREQAAAAEAAAKATAAATPVAPPPTPKPVAKVAPAPVVETPPPPPAPVGETREAKVVTPPRPAYPMQAVRNHTNGWVVVKFTVDKDGSVRNAKVTASQPPRVFDRAALSAVNVARFEPALDKGQPVATTLERKIEFKLSE